LIDGNINAQGSGDIAKTGGFVETSGHDLFIKDNAIVDAKEWLLDPDNVNIINGQEKTDDLSPRGDDPEKKNDPTKNTINTGSIEQSLRRGSSVNISATKKVNVTADINVHNGTLTLHSKQNGVEINGNITSTQNGNLTIKTGGRVDVHKNITLGMGFLNITSDNNIAFEGGDNLTITAQGNIISNKDGKQLRLHNVSLNGTGTGLNFIANQNNFTHLFNGTLNISGKVVINQTTKKNAKAWNTSHDSYWNVSTLTLSNDAKFTFIKYVDSNHSTNSSDSRSFAGVKFHGKNNEMKFNIGNNAKAEFRLKPNEKTTPKRPLPIQFLSNISVTGGGSVFFDIYANLWGKGTELKMDSINVSSGSNLTLNSHVRKYNAFEINKDLTINATNSNFNLRQTSDGFHNGYRNNAINSTHNISILGGNVTLGGQNSSSSIMGNIIIKQAANVTLEADNSHNSDNVKDRTINLGNLTVEGNLSLIGENANINGNLSIEKEAIFKGKTKDSLNITGNFTNNGTAEINISQGVVSLGDITNDGKLNITTHAKNSQKSIIRGNITNKKGSLNITDNKNNAEIEIHGNISQKEGNLTISSDTINITNSIKIQKDINGESSNSGEASNANLTIKTKELKLVNDLNISGFNKAEIIAKEGSDLTIGNTGSTDANTKKVTFNNVKDSKISANGHNVTLNSKVETSDENSNTEGDSDNNAGLTIDAKNVTVNNDITSHKTVNITASENVTTKAGTTINTTTGNVKLTAVTSDIQGGIKSNSGDVNITTSTGSIAGQISAANVTLNTTGTLTTVEGSSINANEGTLVINAKDAKLDGTASGDRTVVNATNASGSGNVTAKTSSSVNITGDLNTINGLNIISENGRNTVRLR
ncbi:adhesin, partial [Haemophilus influenzae]